MNQIVYDHKGRLDSRDSGGKEGQQGLGKVGLFDELLDGRGDSAGGALKMPKLLPDYVNVYVGEPLLQ